VPRVVASPARRPSTSYKYTDRDGTNRLNLIGLKAGEDGKATIKIKGTGDFLNVDWESGGIHGFRLPVTAQLSASNGEC